MEKIVGKFIVLDGPDGCGKSTQTKMLCLWLESKKTPTIRFRDPGDTLIGEKIRQILLTPEHDAMGVRSELLLYMAARAQLWEEKIQPALKSKKCVILDRWISSTCAYQGHAGRFGVENVIALAEQSLERVWPDLTIILDVDLQTAAKRMDRALDRMEQKGDAYREKVRKGFLQLPNYNNSIVIIDSATDIETVHEKIVEAVTNRFLGQ